MVVYPGRNASEFGEGNLALMKLDKDWDFSDKLVKPICLPEADNEIDRLAGKQCTISGWGETDPGMIQFALCNI